MRRGFIQGGLLAVLLLLACAGAVRAAAEPPRDPAEAGQSLRFPLRIEVSNEDRVTLLDLLPAEQELAPEVREQMAALTVSVAPGLGRQIIVAGSKVKALLRQVSLGPEVTFQVPDNLVVVRACQRLSPERMAQLYVEGVRERLGARSEQADIHHVETGRELVLPPGELSTNLRFLRSNMMGRVPAVLEVMVDGRRQADARLTGTVDIYAEVVVAARPLMQQHVIGLDDVEMARVNLGEVGAGAVFDLREAQGMRTRSVFPMGAPLDMTRMDRAPLIRLGDVVVMVYDTGGVRITAKGRAEQTGFLHGRIRLTNLVSKREVWGKVIASGHVVVE